jgi:D-alanyl-D-alanine carboxypeptidase (penicillin-binding protein 5/6)
MNDTHFTNCTGLDADNNYTSAYDVMLMSKELIKHRDIFNYSTIWMDTLRGGKTALYNTNKLIRFYNGANGLKTGSTSKAGYCLSATALRDNMQLIAVVMDCDKVDDRFSSASNLLDYGFANWSYVSPKIKNGSINIQVLHGEKDYVQGVADGSPSILTDKGKENAITQRVSYVPNVLAPVIKGQVVGQITFWVDGKNVGTVPIKANADVGRMTFFKAFGRLFGSMVGS